MRFFWLQSTTNTSVFSPSATLSVAAHVVLLGGAIYGSGPRTITPSDDTTSEQVYFLPPPDRLKTSASAIELQFVERGDGEGMAVAGPASPDGSRTASLRQEPDGNAGGSAGSDVAEQIASAPVLSEDSVSSVLAAEQSAIRVEGSAAPIYPPSLIEQQLDGSVMTHFVIDTAGRVDMATAQFLDATHPLFEQAVRDAMPGMRFYPASVSGHRVRQLVEQRFDFRFLQPLPVSAPAEHTRTNPIPRG